MQKNFGGGRASLWPSGGGLSGLRPRDTVRAGKLLALNLG
jgi:hypothetical protein